MSNRMGMALVGIGPGAVPHLRSLHDLRDSLELRHAVTRRPERADMGPFQGVLEPTSDLQAALADPLVQAVVVATPPSTHLEIASQCFAHGKHVLLEKPLDLSLERAKAIVDTARSADLRLGVVLQFRFRPATLAMEEILRSGRLGTIQAASVRVPWWRPQSYYDQPGRGTLARDGGGVLLTQAIHAIDLFRALVGVSSVVAAQVCRTAVHRMETEDYAGALLTLGNGAPGQLMATTAMAQGLPECIDIIGSLGSAVMEGGALRVQYVDGQSEHIAWEGGTGSGANIMDFPNDAHRALLQDFCQAVVQGREPKVNGDDGLATQSLITQVLQCAGAISDLRPTTSPPAPAGT